MKHIILIEDDPAIADSLQLFFHTMDIHVTCYNSGNPILIGNYMLPDLFLVDKQLSGVDGIDICRHIKSQESTRHIPVIMMSASPAIKTTAPAAGADDVIMKPYDLEDIKKIIEAYI